MKILRDMKFSSIPSNVIIRRDKNTIIREYMKSNDNTIHGVLDFTIKNKRNDIVDD